MGNEKMERTGIISNTPYAYVTVEQAVGPGVLQAISTCGAINKF